MNSNNVFKRFWLLAFQISPAKSTAVGTTEGQLNGLKRDNAIKKSLHANIGGDCKLENRIDVASISNDNVQYKLNWKLPFQVSFGV